MSDALPRTTSADAIGQPTTEQPAAPVLFDLRVWPAAVLLALMWALRNLHTLLPNLGFGGFMLAAFAPLLCGLGIALWWLAFSRARWTERMLGLAGLALAGAVAVALADRTLNGFGIMMYALPWGITFFAVALIALHRWKSTLRTWVAVLVAFAGFGYWDFVRNDGVWGDYRPTFAWRWAPTQEEQFLAGLAAAPAASNAAAAALDGAPGDNAGEVLEPLWPEFRGPNRDNRVPNVALATDWEAQPPREIWRRPAGPNWSSFCVAGDRLFTQEQRGEEEAVVCLDRETGAERWVQRSPGRFWEAVAGAGPRATPTLAGGKLYTLGAVGLLHCLDPLGGNLIWQRDLRDDAGRQPPTWGFSSSPLVVGDLVIVHAGGAGDKGLLAYDAATGEPTWSVACGDHSYSSPQRATLAGRDCVLILTNAGLTAVDAARGAVLWEHPWKYEGYRVIQPLLIDGGGVLLGTGMGTGTRRIDVSLDGDKPSIKEAWTTLDMKPDFNDYVVHEGHLYGFDHNIFGCVDLATGRRAWKGGRYGNGQVLLLPDAGQLLVLTETGEVVLLRTNPIELTELARFQAIEGKTWNHPVLIDNRLYVRNGQESACFELPLAAAAPAIPKAEAAEE
jgi:outer membrane protein assembly factor BamB